MTPEEHRDHWAQLLNRAQAAKDAARAEYRLHLGRLKRRVSLLVGAQIIVALTCVAVADTCRRDSWPFWVNVLAAAVNCLGALRAARLLPKKELGR